MRPTRIEPGQRQESVWDYPRPPRLEETTKRVQVVFNGVTIADTMRARRVLETSHPPVYYIPPEDIQMEHLAQAAGTSNCEFKGTARYYTVTVGDRSIQDAAWYYPRPERGYEAIREYVAFYPSKMDACYVNGERVQAQSGDFYGGWITGEIVGPFKGGPGTRGW